MMWLVLLLLPPLLEQLPRLLWQTLPWPSPCWPSTHPCRCPACAQPSCHPSGSSRPGQHPARPGSWASRRPARPGLLGRGAPFHPLCLLLCLYPFHHLHLRASSQERDTDVDISTAWRLCPRSSTSCRHLILYKHSAQRVLRCVVRGAIPPSLTLLPVHLATCMQRSSILHQTPCKYPAQLSCATVHHLFTSRPL